MAFNHKLWKRTMIKQHGPFWREQMRARGSRGGSVKISKGFGRMDPDRLREVSARGGRKK